MLKKTQAHPHRRYFLILALAILSAFPGVPQTGVAAENIQTKNVILVTTDGLRWQEVFSGADPELMNKQNGGIGNTNEVKAFWHETPEARRRALMPFLWDVIAKKGQVFGNSNKGSTARITNTRKFSY